MHDGHLGLARAAFMQLELTEMLLLPSGNPYQKGRLPFATGAQRVNMLTLAFQGQANIVVDERELRRAGETYTFDTLLELRAAHGAMIADVPGESPGVDLADTDDASLVEVSMQVARSAPRGSPGRDLPHHIASYLGHG